jgi:hypothetical protein
MERRNSTTSPISPSSPTNFLPQNIADLLSTTTPQPQSNQVHPNFHPLIHHLQQRLKPLVSVTTDKTHPGFPTTLLAYNLLTMEQVDNLARHFHQVWPPLPHSGDYPVPIRPWLGTPGERDVDLETRRRRFGRFIGLRGCESPVREGFEELDEMDADEVAIVGDGNGNGNGNGDSEDVAMETEESEREMLDRMEREWQEGLGREYESQGHLWNLK